MPLRLVCNAPACDFRFEGETTTELDRALVTHSQRTGHHQGTVSRVEVDWKARAQDAEAALAAWVRWVEHPELCEADDVAACPEADELALEIVRLTEPVIGRPIKGRPMIAAPAGHRPAGLCLAGELATGCLCRLVRHDVTVDHACPGDPERGHAEHRWPDHREAPRVTTRQVVLGGRVQVAQPPPAAPPTTGGQS